MDIKNQFLIAMLVILILGCKKHPKIFSESDLLIELDAARQKDLINDLSAYMLMSVKDGRFWDNVYPDVSGIPDSLTDIKIYYFLLDNIQALYQSYKAGLVSRDNFIQYYNGWKADTTNCISEYVKTFVVIAAGTSNTGQRYYFFDSDNDLDLSDEYGYETSIITGNSYPRNNNKEFQPHKIIYEKSLNGEIKSDSTWIAFYEDNRGMFIQFCEKISASFFFDSLKYSIVARPSIAKRYKGGVEFNISPGFNKKSTKYLEGEYLKLSNEYYKITCRSDGLQIYLTKDDSAFIKGSTQIGLPPIPFKAETLEGDKIVFPNDFKGKYVLLDFWSLSCGPCIYEIREYYIDIYKQYGGNQFEIIGVANDNPPSLEKFVNKNGIKWIIISDREQKKLQNMYNILQYPTLYLIDPNGEIIAKDDELRGGAFVSMLQNNVQPSTNK